MNRKNVLFALIVGALAGQAFAQDPAMPRNDFVSTMSREAVEAEFGSGDPLVRALALRLATVASEGHGAPAVMALRGLGELVAAQRGGP